MLQIFKKWIIFSKIPDNISYGVAISTGDDIFYVSRKKVDNDKENNCKYIWKYKKNINKWQSLIKLPIQNYLTSWSYNWSFEKHHLALNTNLNKIFINVGIYGVIIINLKTKGIMKIAVSNSDFIIQNFINLKKLNIYYRPIIIHNAHIIYHKSGELHFISNIMHVKWIPDHIHQFFNIMHAWKNIVDWDDFNAIDNTQIIYISLENILLLIGGRDPCHGKNRNIGVWRYEFNNDSWFKIKYLSFPLYGHSAILASNQECIIIDGGYLNSNNKISNIIYILNITNPNKYFFKQCTILSPFINKLYTIQSTGGIKDIMLVNGWIKNTFKEDLFDDIELPPIYLMDFISTYYDKETIHCLLFDSVKNRKEVKHDHVGVFLNDLILSLI